MKKAFFPIIAGIICIAVGMSGCTKLNTPVQSQYTPSVPVTQSDYTSDLGSIYSRLADDPSGNRYAVEYFRLQELSTDEAIIPARNGNYDDGGQYRLLHLHTWSADHPTVTSVWQWGFEAINTCNTMLTLFNQAASSSMKSSSIAEATAMRDLFYFFMMDLYGNIPIVSDTVPGAKPPATAPRAQVFAYIESDLKSVIPTLPTANGMSTYGHATRWMAYALLEKMYLNAGYYTGTPRYTDAVAMADSIQNAGLYTLDANYGSVFAPTNGPQVEETIFAVPYDAQLIPGQQINRYGGATYVYPLYNLPTPESVAMSTDSGFYHQNFTLPGDTRDSFWIRGPQYYFPNQAIDQALYPSSIMPVLTALYPAAIYPASYTTLYANYISGTLPGVLYDLPAPYNIAFWNITYRDSLVLRGDPTLMDVGDDIFAQCDGIRSKKYYPDPNENSETEDANNDVPVFRLGDVLLMKAEAILRGAHATTVKGTLQTPTVLINIVRSRVGAQPTTAPTLDSILTERARELSWECWRRNDLIRFGLFEGAWGFNTGGGNTDLRLFPVPSTELSTNPNLTQNPGY